MIARRALSLLALLGLLASESAMAHTGTHPGSGFSAGFAHPLLGWDHLLAAVAVGLWATRHDGRAVWMLPLTFLAAMVVGIALGATGLGLPAVEPALMASLVVFGAVLALPVRAPLAIAAALLAVFAVFHGHAHGSEMPAATPMAAYGPGLLLATALLHATGVLAGRLAHPLALRLSGLAIGASGVWLLAI